MGALRFEELDVFRRAYKVSLEVHRFTLGLPAIEQYDLGSQMRRASKSICANLAEGFGRQPESKVEFQRFIRIAIGSADEMRVWIRYSLDLGYIDEPTWQHWREEFETIAKMLWGLHKSLDGQSV
jgi:four helix bundle protein